METLSQYVNRITKEKNITALDIEAKAAELGHKITDTYVTNIMQGKNKNLSIEKLIALAEGMEVDKVELFKVAAGIKESEETWTVQGLMRVIQKLFRLKPAEIKQIKKILKVE